MKAPFPWFGGKSSVSHLVWDRFGNTPNYVEPFAGSLAVLLNRPHGAGRNETVNDKDCYLANFWRALSHDPDQVAYYADWPVNESDLHARHAWLVAQDGFREKMTADPDYFDAKVAGWWVWGLSLWIGSGWCVRPEWQGRSACDRTPKGIHAHLDQKRPQLRRGGHGVHRAGHAPETWKQRPRLQGQGVNRQLRNISGDGGASGRDGHSKRGHKLNDYFEALAERLRGVRVCCGDWTRVLGPSPTTKIGLTGVFLDPPYDLRAVRGVEHGSDGAAPSDALYTHHDNDVSLVVRNWAIEHGSDPLLRIALCGYEGEYEMPASWHCMAWKANGGYANQKNTTKGVVNSSRERIWFSPHCLRTTLFEDLSA